MWILYHYYVAYVAYAWFFFASIPMISACDAVYVKTLTIYYIYTATVNTHHNN